VATPLSLVLLSRVFVGVPGSHIVHQVSHVIRVVMEHTLIDFLDMLLTLVYNSWTRSDTQEYALQFSGHCLDHNVFSKWIHTLMRQSAITLVWGNFHMMCGNGYHVFFSFSVCTVFLGDVIGPSATWQANCSAVAS
jgi:hypothetical protein